MDTDETETYELDYAMLTDELFWYMISNPNAKVPYLVR